MSNQTVEKKYTFIEAGRLADFPQQLGRQLVVRGFDIAIFRTADGNLYALDNHTPHRKGGPLAEGIVSGHYLYCPLRDLKISLETGLVQEPDTGSVTTFPVRIEDECVLIGIPQAG
ncbi:nitrite reductase small subunit NirD [Brevibacillus ginsengisoli]|uniref:nitrite reductase small subunit NirD n=1 Tax=Brevibacillus ginsengisoli TaxID=363854 RepID=UPI003CF672F1